MAEAPATAPADDAMRAAAAELAAVRDGLERATRTFTERLERGGVELERARSDAARVAAPPPTPPPRPPAPFAGVPPAAARAGAGAADAEVRAYLEQAKRRADRLLAAMLTAVERETAEIRAGAERDAEARRQRAVADAGAMVEDARRVAERIVAERQRRIGALSDGVIGRAEALTAGLEDAARVQEQFEAFAGALAGAAERIARAAAVPAAASPGAARAA